MPHQIPATVLRQQPIALAITAAFSLAMPFAQATEEAAATLPEMTITQNRPAVLADNPSPQAQVTAEQMRDINVINVEDSLKYAPSLHIRKRYIGDRNSIISTRTSGTIQSARSLVYADGLLLSNLLGNSFGFPPRWGIVGAEEIDTVDVLYGPFSALLPGNSAGATILMTTRRPERLEAHARVQAFTQNFKLYGTDDSYGGHQEQALLGARAGNLSWTLMLNNMDSKGQPMSFATAATSTTAAGGGDTVVTGAHQDIDPKGAGRVIFGATSIDHTVQNTGKIRLAYDFTPDTRAAFTYALWRNDSYSDTQTYLRDAVGNPVWSGNVNIDGFRYTLSNSTFAPSDRNEEHQLAGLTLDSRLNDDWRVEVAASDYDTLTDITRTPTVAKPAAESGGAGRITFADGTGWRNLDLKAIWKPAAGTAGHTATFGYHRDEYTIASRQYNASNWRSDASTTTLRNSFSGKTSTTALFAQGVWKFDPRWTATLGLRHEHWEAFDGTRFDTAAPLSGSTHLYPRRDNRFNSPKASLTWQASSDWLLRASLARAYRFPTVSELFQTETRGTTTFISDPNLKPEKVLAKDLTAEGAALGGILRLSLFEEQVNDGLYSQTNISVTPNITSVQNIDRIRFRGIETAWQASNVWTRGLDISGSLTYVNSRVLANAVNPDVVGKRAQRVPDWRLSAFAAYRIDEHWSTSLGLKYSGRQYNELDNSDSNPDVFGGASRFTTLDARVGYQFGKLVRASLGVDNLTNEKYYAFHPYPQRTWHAEVRFDY